MSPAVVETIYKVSDIGRQQYQEFTEQRLQTQTKSLDDTVKRNALPCFANPGVRTNGISRSSMAVLKNDCALFSKLFIACQTRNGDLDSFFRLENQPWPPSLFKVGELRTGNKADLVGCLVKAGSACEGQMVSSAPTDEFLDDTLLEEAYDDLLDFAVALPDEELEDIFLSLPEEPWEDISLNTDLEPVLALDAPQVEVNILHGAAVVQMLSPKLVTSFQEYADSVFAPFIRQQLKQAHRLDIIFDVYLPDSLKAATREKRGAGLHRKVSPSASIPGNWSSFLRDDKNKEELFQFLATSAAKLCADAKQIVFTCGNSVMSSQPLENEDFLQPCAHEEADTRIILHAKHCSNEGHKKIMMRTTDTDVVILAVVFAHHLELIELWIAFGTGKRFRYIAAHVIARKLGQELSQSLPVFHAFTGCDTVSFFSGRGKATAWDTWRTYPKATKAFLALANGPERVPDSNLVILERFVVLLYDKSGLSVTVNDARKDLFFRKGRSVENIPPSQAALQQHILQSVFQGGHVRGKCLQKDPHYPSPSQWRWKKTAKGQEKPSRSWLPVWTTLDQAATSCRELISCSCKKSCTGNCSCSQAQLSCTALCNCVCRNKHSGLEQKELL